MEPVYAQKTGVAPTELLKSAVIDTKTLPAVFIAANMEGTVPLATEAALYLAKLLCEKADMRSDRTWYILACGNPDAASGHFSKPQRLDGRNARPKNDDQDDATDEDGPDDLDGEASSPRSGLRTPKGPGWPSPATRA